ncbi:unnamed protein product [Pedinophyceae sp. YPF-701]|nr:unnamed protein product [Pedinophyceae sp. YPF-701]
MFSRAVLRSVPATKPVQAPRPAARPALLSNAFAGADVKGFRSTLAGGIVSTVSGTQTASRGALLVTCGGRSLGCTKFGSARKVARVSGFRARMKSKTGRKVLKARRARGRKVLVTTSTQYSKQKGNKTQ